MAGTMEKGDIVHEFMGSIHCSQVVVKQWAQELGYEEEELMRMASAFGGGCFEGELCGSVAGAMMVIGARYGHSEYGDREGNARMMEKVAEFKRRFIEKHGALACRDIVGYDFSKEGQMQAASASGTLLEKCPDFVNTALEILDDIIED